MKKLLAAAGTLTCATLMLAAPAMARVNVDLHVGVGLPGVYVYPAPVYAHPQPMYVQPYPVYVHPAPVYAPPPHAHWHRPSGHFRQGPAYGHGYHPYGDRDRDGIPNRWDHRPRNPYRH